MPSDSARESLALAFLVGAITASIATLVALDLPAPAQHMDITCAGMWGCSGFAPWKLALPLLLIAIASVLLSIPRHVQPEQDAD